MISLTPRSTVTINVTAVDEPPVFTEGAESITFAEDGDITAVLGNDAYAADDPEDADAPTLKLGGADSGKFSFDPSIWRAHVQGVSLTSRSLAARTGTTHTK